MKFDKIIIECSPFMRTMQSSAGIAKALGVKEIHLNYMACEHLFEPYFPLGNPVL